MSSLVRAWRSWRVGRKFAKKGRKFVFGGQYMEVKGHVEVGDACRFHNNVVLRTHGDGKIIFGNRSGCSWNCVIDAADLVQIGSFTGIAENTVIRDTNHVVYGTDAHWRYTPLITAPVIIGENCFIGSGVYIGPGVTIEEGAVIAQGSIVSKNVGAYEIWAGAPARLVAHRTKNVSETVLKRNLELVKAYGVRKDRYLDSPTGTSGTEAGTSGNDAGSERPESDAE